MSGFPRGRKRKPPGTSLPATPELTIRDTGSLVGTRTTINLIPGAGIDLSITENTDPGTLEFTEQIDVLVTSTIGAPGGGTLIIGGTDIPDDVLARCDYTISPTANNTTANGAAQTVINQAITDAGDGGSITLVGNFYVSASVSLNGVSRFTLEGLGRHTTIAPSDLFPNGSAVIVAGQTATYRPFNSIVNLQVDGRMNSFYTYTGTPPNHVLTIQKTITGIKFGSFAGRLRHLDITNFTGWCVDFTANAVNESRWTTLVNVTTIRGLAGNVRAGAVGGRGVTIWGGAQFQAGNAVVSGNKHDLAFNACPIRVDADDCRIVGTQPYGSTGASVGVGSGVKRLQVAAGKIETSGHTNSTLRGGIVATGGGSLWAIVGTAFHAGKGTNLDLTNTSYVAVHGGQWTGSGIGTAPGAETAIKLTGATNNTIAGANFDNEYTAQRFFMAAGNRVRGFTGGNSFTDKNGSHTVATTNGSIDIAHGLGFTINLRHVALTPRADMTTNGRLWVTNPTTTGTSLASHFKLNWAGMGTTPSVPVSWRVRYQP